MYTADSFSRRRRMTVPLSRLLKSRFQVRAAPLRKGDTVRVRSGSFAGREERVAKINRRDYSVTLDNVTAKTTGEKMKGLPIRPSHLVITRLNLADPWRRRALRVRDEDVTPEELGETAPEAPAGETTPPAPAAAAEPVDVPTDDPVPAAAPKRRPRSAPPTEASE